MPDPHPHSVETAVFRPDLAMSAARTEMLRNLLPHAMACLKARQANLIAEDVIDDYVALDWLEWAGGGLRLTEVGRNVCNAMARRQG